MTTTDSLKNGDVRDRKVIFDFIDATERQIESNRLHRKEDYPDGLDHLNATCEFRALAHKMMGHLRHEEHYYYTDDGSPTGCSMCDDMMEERNINDDLNQRWFFSLERMRQEVHLLVDVVREFQEEHGSFPEEELELVENLKERLGYKDEIE